MIDENKYKNLTWAHYKEEREKIRKEVKERIQKDKINITEQGNKALVYFRSIIEEDAIKLFKLNEKDLLYLHRDRAILALAYYLDEDINYLDKLDIKDLISGKLEKDLESYFRNSCKINNNISDGNFYVKFLWSWLTKLKEHNIKEGSLHRYVDKNKINQEDNPSTRYLLESYLKNFFDYGLYKEIKLPDYEKINFLKNNNISKKIDYLSYVKDSISSHDGFLEIDAFDLESTTDNRFLSEGYQPNEYYPWAKPEIETSSYINGLTGKATNNEFKIIKSTNLLFTGIVNSYDEKKRLISQKTYINGIYAVYGTYYNYDYYGEVLNGGKKIVTPKEEILYSHDNKVWAKYKKEPKDIGLEEIGILTDRDGFGEIINYDEDQKIIGKGLKRNTQIINSDLFNKRNIHLNFSKSEIQKLSFSDNEYSVMLLNEEDDYWCGLEEGYSGFGDPELIHDQNGYVNYPSYDSPIARSDILYNFSCKYNSIIASYNFFDELTGLYFLSKSFYEKCQKIDLRKFYSTDKKSYADLDNNKFVSLISFLPTSEKYQIMNKCIAGMNNFIDKNLNKLSLSKIPIFSNKIHVLLSGDFKCQNGWHPVYSARNPNYNKSLIENENGFVYIRLNKADPFKPLTKTDLSHLKKVAKEFNDDS